MNAGAYGGELCQVLKEATVLTPEGEVKTLSLPELELGYRTSCVQKMGYISCWRQYWNTAGKRRRNPCGHG